MINYRYRFNGEPAKESDKIEYWIIESASKWVVYTLIALFCYAIMKLASQA